MLAIHLHTVFTILNILIFSLLKFLFILLTCSLSSLSAAPATKVEMGVGKIFHFWKEFFPFQESRDLKKQIVWVTFVAWKASNNSLLLLQRRDAQDITQYLESSDILASGLHHIS